MLRCVWSASEDLPHTSNLQTNIRITIWKDIEILYMFTWIGYLQKKKNFTIFFEHFDKNTCICQQSFKLNLVFFSVIPIKGNLRGNLRRTSFKPFYRISTHLFAFKFVDLLERCLNNVFSLSGSFYLTWKMRAADVAKAASRFLGDNN